MLIDGQLLRIAFLKSLLRAFSVYGGFFGTIRNIELNADISVTVTRITSVHLPLLKGDFQYRRGGARL